ncbi:MAG: LysM peptidoglycan-binding domain-containing protein [Candidatus Binataceae bacterium]
MFAQVTPRVFNAKVSMLSLAVAFAIAVAVPCLAQTSDLSETDVPPSGSPPSSVVSSPEAPMPAAPRAAAPWPPVAATSPSTTAEAVPKPPPRPRTTIPYTIRPGDSIGSIAQMFGLTADELARINRLHPDDELMAGDELKVPNPFIAQVNGLQAQVNSLSAQAQSAEQKVDADERELSGLRDKVQDLTSDNQSLTSSLRLLPWWHATALSATVAALLMFGVMVVTLFEWWRMRRRYVALASLADDLGRLDYKYKAMMAKAELRLQQLYGRRRGGMTDGQPRPKMPEEIEIERLNEELKEVLQRHLARMGGRSRNARKRARWRELFGSNVDSPVEARSARR